MLFVTLLHKWPRYFRIRNCVIKLMNMSSATNKGEFVRKASSFRNWITKDGSSGFPSAAGRYHLYVSLACPWAHRTLIVRRLKGLDKVISVNVVDHFMGEKGWKFDASVPDATADTVNDCTYIREVYFKADKDYQVRFSMYVVILAIVKMCGCSKGTFYGPIRIRLVLLDIGQKIAFSHSYLST